MREQRPQVLVIVDEQYARARKLIEDNRERVEAMAKALLEFETIDSDQIGDIMAGKPPRPPKPTSTPAPGTTIAPGTMGGTAPSANPAKTSSSLRAPHAGGGGASGPPRES